MEPKPKRGQAPRSIASVKSGKTSKSTDHSGGRQTARAQPKGTSHSAHPIAPPRLKSRSGGQVVRNSSQRQKPKR